MSIRAWRSLLVILAVEAALAALIIWMVTRR